MNHEIIDPWNGKKKFYKGGGRSNDRNLDLYDETETITTDKIYPHMLKPTQKLKKIKPKFIPKNIRERIKK